MILFLNGPSSCGKTSIVKELQKIRPDIKVVGIDNELLQQFNNYVESKLTNDEITTLKTCFYLKTPNYFELISGKIQTPNLTSSKKKELKIFIYILKNLLNQFNSISCPLQIETQMINRIFMLASEGKNVIVDCILPDFKYILLKKKFKTAFILTYCELKDLHYRILKRDAMSIIQSNYLEFRMGTYPLAQFSEFFKVQEKEEEEPVLTCNIQEFQEVFQDLKSLQERYYPEEDTQHDLSADDLLYKMGYDPTKKMTQELFLTPRKSLYNQWINTSVSSPLESSQSILTYFS